MSAPVLKEASSLSLEARWFGSGAPSAELETWFAQRASSFGIEATRSQARTDRYLVLRGCPQVGLKLRGGKLEVKAQRGPGISVELHAGLHARLEAWTKWSAAGSAVSPLVSALGAGSPSWISCAKSRALFACEVAGGSLIPNPEQRHVRSGGAAELTTLEVAGATHWTFAIELFGAVAEQLDAEAALPPLRSLLGASTPPDLAQARCASYPAWLSE